MRQLEMGVDVDQPRRQHAVLELELLDIAGRGDARIRTDCGDASVGADENGAVLDRRRRDREDYTRTDAEHALRESTVRVRRGRGRAAAAPFPGRTSPSDGRPRGRTA